MPSLYAQYIKERENRECLEHEHGFASYQIIDDGIYVEEVYIVPEKRQTGLASDLVDKIAEQAKALGKKYIYTSVSPHVNGSTISIKAITAYGFELHNSSRDLIMFIKEI